MLQQMRSAAKWIWVFIVICFVGGFLFVQTSGLLGRERITTNTVVGTVNGVDIPYLGWQNLANSLQSQQERQTGKGLTLDERRRVEDEAFDQLVSQILLDQEYRRRSIKVTSDEIVQAAQFSPPPELVQNPELLTDGQFDPAKYQRLLKSSSARQNGLLVQLENYYRGQIPRSKLFDQLASGVYVSDAKLWGVYRDLNDTVQVSFVSFNPAGVADSSVTISDAEIKAYYDANKSRFDRPGRAVVSLLVVPRSLVASDSIAARDRALQLREEIVGGAKFEDVAKRESADTVSGALGGSLGRGGKGRFVADFEKAAYALPVGQVSPPVVTSFGVHLIKVTEHKGDTLAISHILVKLQQSDSNATRTDRRADSLARIAASATQRERFDSAARMLKLEPMHAEAIEGQPLVAGGRQVASVSAWAFSGVKKGETSDLFDSEEAYYVARLDSLAKGGIAPMSLVAPEIRQYLAQAKKSQALLPRASAFAKSAKESSLEAAAKGQDITVTKSEPFARPGFVPGLGRLNAAIGGAFVLPTGAVSEPIVTDDAVIVMRVDRRVDASHATWEQQKETQRKQALGALRESQVRSYLDGLRKAARIKDRRKELNEAARAQAATTT